VVRAEWCASPGRSPEPTKRERGPMKIGLDARSMVATRPRGTGRNLLDAYRLIPSLRPSWRFVLYHQRSLPGSARPTAEHPWHHPNVGLRRIDLPGDRLNAWFQVRLPLAAWRDRIDLMHFPANTAPAWCPVPFIMTVHDLIPLKLPGELPRRETRAFRRGLLRGLRRATHIITVSTATRDDLHQDFGIPLSRMTVIPWAPDTGVQTAAHRRLDAEQKRQIQARYDLADRWLLTFSGSTRRKNARGVLDGFARTKPEPRRHTQLVLVGCEPESYRMQLTAQAERLGIRDQCRILGFVPHADVPGLFGGSSGLLMPSRYEGFGLPILDAFASRVPVLTSSRSSMPEVAGDAAVYCDPDDPRSIAAGIEQVLEPTTAEGLITKGCARLSLFSWQRTAELMCTVYETCLNRRPAPHPTPAGLCGGGA